MTHYSYSDSFFAQKRFVIHYKASDRVTPRLEWQFWPFKRVSLLAGSPVEVSNMNMIQDQHEIQLQGSQCCADDAISFHYLSEERMHEYEYLIYRVGKNLALNTMPLDPGMP